MNTMMTNKLRKSWIVFFLFVANAIRVFSFFIISINEKKNKFKIKRFFFLFSPTYDSYISKKKKTSKQKKMKFFLMQFYLHTLNWSGIVHIHQPKKKKKTNSCNVYNGRFKNLLKSPFFLCLSFLKIKSNKHKHIHTHTHTFINNKFSSSFKSKEKYLNISLSLYFFVVALFLLYNNHDHNNNIL